MKYIEVYYDGLDVRRFVSFKSDNKLSQKRQNNYHTYDYKTVASNKTNELDHETVLDFLCADVSYDQKITCGKCSPQYTGLLSF